MAASGHGLQIGAVLGNKYRIERLLGAGAMGAVYRVVDEQGRTWAAKTLRHGGAELSDGPGSVARFVREGSEHSSLTSEHIVSVVDVGVDDRLHVPFFVMSLLSGFHLETLLERVGAIHPTVAVRMIVQACRGLIEAHSRGVVHRDIKPSNLFLHHGSDGRVTVKVCDFGIAKWSSAQDTLTSSGTFLGTPLYMSPEQATNSKRVDARADVWSVAQSLYHALAGVPAFERVGSLARLMLSIVKGQIPPLQDIAPWVHPGLASIVHGALIADPNERCPGAEEFAAALSAFTGDSEDLTVDMLAPIPPEVRAQVAPRGRLPVSWTSMTEITSPATTESYAAERDPLAGTTLSNRYHLDRVIGRGGMGAIYAGRTPEGQSVAIKVILESPEGPRSEVMRRFVREARALTSIQSPNVVRVVDVDSDVERQIPYIVMELLNGNDLGKLVKKWGALEPGPALRLFIEAGKGIAAAHALGIIHRDIKPANIFLHELPGGEVLPKVCDFGIAKRIATAQGEENTVELTRSGGFIGSPVYMSPEQARSAKHVDTRTDIWSLGISLWEVLSGCRPWDRCASVGELILAICSKPVTPLQDVAPWISSEVAAIVHRCLVQEPADRIASVEELIAALEPHASRINGLTRQLLVPVSAETRAMVAPRSAVAVHELAETRLHRYSTTPTGAAASAGRRRVRIAAMTTVLVGASVAIGLVAQSSRKVVAETPTASIAPPKEAASPPLPMTSALVAIRPLDAKVTVDGAPRELADGGLLLAGQPGDSIMVVATLGTARVEKSVVITKDGRAQPDSIEIPPSPSATTTARSVPAGARKAAPVKDVNHPKDEQPIPPAQPEVKAAENW